MSKCPKCGIEGFDKVCGNCAHGFAFSNAQEPSPDSVLQLAELMRGLEIGAGMAAEPPRVLYEVGRAIAAQAKRAAEPSPSGDLVRVYEALGIGENARTINVLLTNIENMKRFADYLDAIEREFFMVAGEPSDEPEDAGAEPEDVCLLNRWGSTQEEYVEQFRSALAALSGGVMVSREDTTINEKWIDEHEWITVQEISNGLAGHPVERKKVRVIHASELREALSGRVKVSRECAKYPDETTQLDWYGEFQSMFSTKGFKFSLQEYSDYAIKKAIDWYIEQALGEDE